MLLSRAQADPVTPPVSGSLLGSYELRSTSSEHGGVPSFPNVEHMARGELDSLDVLDRSRSTHSPIPCRCLSYRPIRETHGCLGGPGLPKGSLEVLGSWDNRWKVGLCAWFDSVPTKRLPDGLNSLPISLLVDVSSRDQLVGVG